MVETRLRIKYGVQRVPDLSVQHLMACNYMTEGCRGGWSIFNGFFAENNGLVEEKCAPYMHTITGCSKYERCPEVARVSKSYFLSDNSESGIQREIMKNGAVDANWNVPAAAYSYSTGVLT